MWGICIHVVCTCVYNGRIYVHICVAYVWQRSHSPHYFEAVSLTEPGAHQSAKLAGQLAPGSACLNIPSVLSKWNKLPLINTHTHPVKGEENRKTTFPWLCFSEVNQLQRENIGGKTRSFKCAKTSFLFTQQLHYTRHQR